MPPSISRGSCDSSWARSPTIAPRPPVRSCPGPGACWSGGWTSRTRRSLASSTPSTGPIEAMWTEAWKRMLGRPDALGAVTRSSLWGLTAQLRRAAEERPEEDDGRRDCLTVVDALGELTASAAFDDVAMRGEVRARGPRLAALAGEFLADADVARALGHPGWNLSDAPDSRLWSLILTGLLRVEVEVANRWRI